MEPHQVVSRDEWLVARKAHLAREKELTRARDELARQRRALPWVRVEKPYVFTGPDGREMLGDLFAGRSQLIVKHFMFGPGWQQGCVGCSFHADHVDGGLVHLEHHDVTFVVVSRAPLPEIAAFKKRMGWRFKWLSSHGSDFNYDYQVSFMPEDIARGEATYNYDKQPIRSEELSGLSVFCKDAAGDIFHTYSTYGRGSDLLLGTYNYLDLVPKGRDETGPNHNLTDWVRHHDRYDVDGGVDSSERFRAGDSSCRHALEPSRFEDRKPLHIAGLDGRYTAATMKDVPAQWQRFAPRICQIPGRVGGATYGVCRSNGAEAFDYMCGVEVSDGARLPDGLSHIRLPAQPYAVFAHRDHVATIRDTVEAIWRTWLPASGHQVAEGPFFERYDETFDPRNGTGGIEIWIPIRHSQGMK